MFYSIKIRLPKNKVKQYAASNFVKRNFSTLSNYEILDLLNNFANHIALAKNLISNYIIHNQEKIFWDPTDTQKQFITNYYTNPAIHFADQNTAPNENNTLDEKSGKEIYTVLKNSKLSLDQININYLSLGLNPQNCIRYIGKNYFIPNNINSQYIYDTKLLTPTPEIFERMIQDFVKNKWIKLPLNSRTWSKNKYINAYYYNGQYYSIPRVDNINIDPKLLEVFNRVKDETIPTLTLENFTIEAISIFKENLSNSTSLAYEEYKKSLPDCYDKRTNQQAKYFSGEEDGVNYYVPNYDRLPLEIKEELQKDVITSNSIANEVFRDIRDNQKDLLNLEGDFETEFKCSRDPRFLDFLNTLESIDGQQNKENIFRYLFNALKYRGVQEESGIRSFNISTDHFKTQKTILPEFQLFFNKGWYCRTNVLQDNEINGKGIKLMRAKFSPRNYKFDAVLHKNNKVYCIMEYDGLDHFRPRNTSSNFVLKLTSDQVKCAFVDYLEKNNEPIKIIRIPDYKKQQKNETWKTQFKQFILNLLNGYLGNEQTPENINPSIYQTAAYKIKKLIK